MTPEVLLQEPARSLPEAKKPAGLATHDPNGSIHVVAAWFGWLGDVGRKTPL